MKYVHCEIRGNIWVITLDRPKANAITSEVSRELCATFLDFQKSVKAQVAILTATGEKFFSAGWDLKSANEAGPDNEHGDGGFAGITELWALDKPVIAAINGIAFGGGFELAMACDLIIASENASFALPEARVGLLASAGGIIRLPRMLPRVVANDLLMTGRSMDSTEAYNRGLINQVTTQSELMLCAMEYAESVCNCAPLSLRGIKNASRCIENLTTEQSFTYLRDTQIPAYSDVWESLDAKEGITAFNEKRPPNWQGS